MGNFSKDPDQMLADAVGKDYVSALIQQGVPLMDRDANLMSDMAQHWTQETNRRHIGNGVPTGSDGFLLSDVDLDNNDFNIQSGDILANGFLITLAADTTYQTQPVQTSVAPLPDGDSFVYLQVSTQEIGTNDDPDLGNEDDVGIETSRRRKVVWEVLVSETEITTADHILLATLTVETGVRAELTDARVTNLTVAANRLAVNDHETRIVTAENHIANTGNPHNVTAAQIGALLASDYDLGQRVERAVTFSEADGNGASRTVNVGFQPSFVLVVGTAEVNMVGRNLGGPVFAYADISRGITRCFGPVVLADATNEWWYTSTTSARLCDATFTNRNAGIRAETLRVTISQVNANGLTLELFRFSLGGGLNWDFRLNLLCMA